MRSKVGYRAVLAGCLMVLSWYVSSCGGGAHGGHIAPEPGQEPTVAVTAPGTQAELAFPPDEQYVDPGEILARRGSWAAISRKAGNDVYAKSTNAAPDDPFEQISLNPDGTPAGSWAVYRFLDIVPTDLPLRIDAEFTPGNSPEELYIGISDYAAETWHWSTVDTPAAWNSVDLPDGVYPISPGGSLYVVVCVLGTEPALLESVLLGAVDDVNRISGFLASAGTETDRVVLNWNRPGSADGYLIEYLCTTGGYPLRWNKLAEIDGDWNLEYDHMLDGAKPAERFEHYRYRIKATLVGDTSRDWVEAEGFVGSQVQGFNASDGMYDDLVHLTWEPILDGDGYRIEHYDGGYQHIATIDSADVTEYDFFDAELNQATNYRICLIYDGTPTEYWATDDGYPGLVHFQKVQGFTASSDEAEMIRLAWEPLAGADSYLIEYHDDTQAEAWTPLVSIDNPDATEYLHTVEEPAEHGVQVGLPTSYRITSVKGEQVGLYWTHADGICGLTEIDDVVWFSATKDQPEQVVLQWWSVQYATGYRLEYRDLSGGTPAEWTLLATPTSSSFEHNETTPPGNELNLTSFYEYRVAAVVNGITSQNWETEIGYASPLLYFKVSDGKYTDRIKLDWAYRAPVELVILDYRNTEGGDPADWTLLSEFSSMSTSEFVHTAAYPAGREAQEGVLYEYRLRTVRGGQTEAHGVRNHGYYGETGPGEWYMAGRDRSHTRRSTCIGPQTNDLAWSASTGYYHLTTGNFSLDDHGNMYLGTDNGLSSLSRDGELRWTAAWQPCTSPAITTSSEVLGAFFRRGIQAYNMTGESLWYYSADCAYGSIALGTDGAIIFGEFDGKLTVLNEDGTFRWSYQTDGQIDGTAAVADDGTIYIYSNVGNLYALTSAGGLFWTYDLGEEPHNWRYHSEPAIGADGTVYIGGHDGRFHALNPDGSVRWVIDTGGEIATSSAISGDGTILTACGSAGIVALNTNGTVRWTFVPGDAVHSSPAVDAEGNVYFNCYDSYFYALTNNGDELWRYRTYSLQASEVTLTDGALYCADYDVTGQVLAFGTDSY